MSRLTQAVRSCLPISIRRYLLKVGLYAGDWLYLDLLRRWGLRPSLLIDVGAYEGEWTKFASRVFPGSRILMIEAQQAKRARLQALADQSASVELEMALLGPTDGATVSFIEMETGSSVLPEGLAPNGHRVDIVSRTLDSILAERRWTNQAIDLLKLDVQGFELKVLLGAEEAVARTEFVVLEASLIEVNQGCPLITDVIAHMVARHFVLIDIWSQVRRGNGALWQTDLLFVRADSRFRPGIHS